MSTVATQEGSWERDEGIGGSRGNRRNRVRPERRGDGEERRADYEEPQRNLLQKAIHAGDDRQKGGRRRRAAGWVLIDLREGVRTGVTGGAKTLGGGSAWLAGYGRLRATTGGHRDRVEISRNGRAKGREGRGHTGGERQPDSRDKPDQTAGKPAPSTATPLSLATHAEPPPLLVALPRLVVLV
jgi:hypothetical protein